MKIAIMSPYGSSQHSGWGRITNDLCEFLHKKNIDFNLFLPKDHEKLNSSSFSEKIIYNLPPMSTSCKSFNFIKYLFWKPEKLFQKFDLVHSIVAFPYCYLAYKIKKMFNIPYIISVAGTYGVKPLKQIPDSFFLNKSYNNANHIIALSNFTKKHIVLNSKQNISGKISIITGSINTNYLLKSKYKYDQSLLNKKFLLSVGEFKSRKGYHLILKALPEIFKQNSNLFYVHAGFNNGFSFEKHPELKPYKEKIIFLGKVPDEILIGLYRSCYIYIQTPINIDWNFEGFGLVFIEANLFEKPVIASNSGGVPDAVLNAKTGLICGENNFKEIENNVNYLMKNKKIYENMKSNCKKWALDHDVNIVLEKVIKIYKKILN